MNYLRQVQRGIDYVEQHLDEDIDIAEVARHAGISQWHYQRIFKALTNETLMVYIRSRRFANALDKLADTEARIIDIAMAAGFDTQESFTRAFKKAFGVTPASYRKRRRELPFLRKVRFDADYIAHLHGGLSLEPVISDEKRFTFVGMRTLFHGSGSDKNNMATKLPALWSRFMPRRDDVPHAVPGAGYGVIRQSASRSDELEYCAAVQVVRAGKLPRGMELIELPAARYAIFTHKGDPARLDDTVNYIYSSWLVRSGMRHTYGADLEIYGSRYVPDSEQSVIEYAIPIAAT